jgi:hypothetical protein
MTQAPRGKKYLAISQQEHTMKTMRTKELLSLVGIAVAAPVFAVTLVAAAHAAAVAVNDVLLFALVVCGAVHGGVNGFGRRTLKSQLHSAPDHRVTSAKVVIPS